MLLLPNAQSNTSSMQVDSQAPRPLSAATASTGGWEGRANPATLSSDIQQADDEEEMYWDDEDGIDWDLVGEHEELFSLDNSGDVALDMDDLNTLA